MTSSSGSAAPRPAGPRALLGARLASRLPRGCPLDDQVWAARHRMVLALIWTHVVGLGAYGIIRGYELVHVGVELAGIAFVGAGARLVKGRAAEATLATLALVLCSALLVHLSGGLIEAHFHFFIVVLVVTLYESWAPFLLALVFVVIHHGTVGVTDPSSVYNHAAAVRRPWVWAGVHGLFIAGAAAAALASWKHAEVERERAEDSAVRLHDRMLRQREAIQINDTVVQGLVAAKYSVELGDIDAAAAAVDRTLRLAKQLVADLIDQEPDMFEPGGLRQLATAEAPVSARP